MRGSEPSELGLDLVRPDPSHLEDRSSLSQLGDHCGRGCARRAPLAIEGDALDAAVPDHQRNADEIAAGCAAGGAGVRAVRDGPTPGFVPQVILKELAIHARKLKRLQPAV